MLNGETRDMIWTKLRVHSKKICKNRAQYTVLMWRNFPYSFCNSLHYILALTELFINVLVIFCQDFICYFTGFFFCHLFYHFVGTARHFHTVFKREMTAVNIVKSLSSSGFFYMARDTPEMRDCGIFLPILHLPDRNHTVNLLENQTPVMCLADHLSQKYDICSTCNPETKNMFTSQK